MTGSGEAESRAIAGAVKNAIGQARVDAGVNITGLLADIDSADSVDYRQHFMCWHLTRTLRPSLTEKLPPAMVRRVLDSETVPSRILSPSHRAWRTGSPSDLSAMQMPEKYLVAPVKGWRPSLHRELCRVSQCTRA
jgi:hypothetical protein